MFDYETSPNERAVIQAVALRAGTTWTVFLIDGTDPTVRSVRRRCRWCIRVCDRRGIRRNRLGRQAHPLDAARIALLSGLCRTR